MSFKCLDDVSSTWISNNLDEIGVLYTIDLLRGKWKGYIIKKLAKENQSYSQLKHSLETITESALAKKLRELQEDGIIAKKIYHTKPLKTEYFLTDKGKDLSKILDEMQLFGKQYSSIVRDAFNKYR